ncbi:CoA transferase [Chrysiogenes arsenatis]|uniref:CoA transferase n=1 Tax=Chrysiogenes arsenatis TaxID=309797 RepID=UPI0004127689|nr:CoA transferase [Chrysiogenes arsenatis]
MTHTRLSESDANFHTILHGCKVVNVSLNLPGPAAAEKLANMGAHVTKVEPPTGDPMQHYCPYWYQHMAAGQTVVTADLKSEAGKSDLDALLRNADVLLTASRPAALQRLGLDWESLRARYPRLCVVSIVGYPAPNDHVAGHDLTYQAALGLIFPPHMPVSLLTDISGAAEVVTTVLGLLFQREKSGTGAYRQVSLVECALPFVDPLKYGSTLPNGGLGGAIPEYNLYQTQDGWIAVAALEPHFKERLEGAFSLSGAESYRAIFATESSLFWQEWAHEHDVPIEIVKEWR